MKMGGDDSDLESDNFDWNSDDDREIENFQSSSPSTFPNGSCVTGSGEASSSGGSPNSKVHVHFVGMGFPREMVSKVIREYGEENEAKLLEELLTYSAIENSPRPQQQIEPDPCSSEHAGSSSDDFSDSDTSFDDEEIAKTICENDDNLQKLVKMGFKHEEAVTAVERLDPFLVQFLSTSIKASILELWVPKS